MRPLNYLKNKNIAGKIFLLRVDFNLTEGELKKPLANLRLLRVLPTIKFLLGRKARIVVMSHRGRPASPQTYTDLPAKISERNLGGQAQINADTRVKKRSNQLKSTFSLRPFVKILSSLLKTPVHFIDFQEGFNSVEIKKIIASSNAKIFLLENLRFLSGEEKNDASFAKKLASLGDFYVNDAFSVSHRKNASIAVITKFFPDDRIYAGFSFENEVKNLSRAFKKPRKPLVIILGGAKVADKIGIIKNFLKKTKSRSERNSAAGADYFLLGGVMANTFLAAKNFPIGDSLYEKKSVSTAKQLLKSGKIILPVDFIVEKRKILDIGPKTIEEYSKIIKTAKTIIWNGPMGYIEDKKFRKGSEKIAKAIFKSGAFAVIGGGETVSLLRNARNYAENNAELCGKKRFRVSRSQASVSPRIFMSTGGGAMLKLLAGEKLPAVKILQWKKKKTK